MRYFKARYLLVVMLFWILSLPFLAEASILIDGDISDWTDIPILITDSNTSDDDVSQPGSDIEIVKIAVNTEKNRMYFLIEIVDAVSSDLRYRMWFDNNLDEQVDGDPGDRQTDFLYDGDSWYVESQNMAEDSSFTYIEEDGSVAVNGQYIEGSVGINELGIQNEFNFAGRSMTGFSTDSPYSPYDWFFYPSTLVIEEIAKAGGTEICDDGIDNDGDNVIDCDDADCSSDPACQSFEAGNWSAIDSGTTQTLMDIWGNSENDVFAVGSDGTILHYDGSTWSPMESGTTDYLWGVWGSSENDVFAVGGFGTILHYDGNNWNTMPNPTSVWLRDVWGSSGNDVFVVGGSSSHNGTILHYDGVSWTEMHSDLVEIHGVWGSSGNDVFAVGEAETILHYDGINWGVMNDGGNRWIEGVWGSSDTDVFAVVAGGPIIQYDGSNWSSMSESLPELSHKTLGGYSNRDVFTVGLGGAIKHFNGTTWNVMDSGTTNSLLGVWGSPNQEAFAVGSNGTILHYTVSSCDDSNCTSAPGCFKPVLSFPEHGAALEDSTPDLSWAQECGNINYFHIQIANDSGFANIVCEQESWQTFNFTPGDQACSELSNGMYWWRVRAHDADSDTWSDWSQRSFTISGVCTDADNDGFYAESDCGSLVDCDDTDPEIHPTAAELCNGIDDNCDGQIDEGVKNTYFLDNDGDGYGNADNSTVACTAPIGYVNNSDDCNDDDANIYPGAEEQPNGEDDNCDGRVDESISTYFRDRDGDGYGDPDNSKMAQSQPENYVSNANDCDDSDANVNPGANENCHDGNDNDCNGQIDSLDENCPDCTDNDGDGYYAEANCGTEVDCNDSIFYINPGAPEICSDGLDNDCNGKIDCELSAPELLAPQEGQIFSSIRSIELRWNSCASKFYPNLEYCVQITENKGAEGSQDDVQIFKKCQIQESAGNNEIKFEIPQDTLERGKQYFWAVWAVDEYGNAGPVSEWWYFDTSFDKEYLKKSIEKEWNDAVGGNFRLNLMDRDSYDSFISKMGADIGTVYNEWKSWITAEDVNKKYNEHYANGVEFNCLRLKSLYHAKEFLEADQLKLTNKYFNRSLTYSMLSSKSFGLASALFDQSWGEAEAISRTIKETCQMVVEVGATIAGGPTAGKMVNYFYLGVDGAADCYMEGIDQAAKNALIKVVVGKAMNGYHFEACGGKTLSEYLQNRVGKYTFPAIQKLTKNPAFQKTLSKVIKEKIDGMAGDYLVDLTKEQIEELKNNLANACIQEFETGVSYKRASVYCPVTIHAVDGSGNVTGLKDGDVLNNIPVSYYANDSVIIYLPQGESDYTVTGEEDGTYDMEVVSSAEELEFKANAIPIKAQEKHTFQVKDDEFVHVDIDENGDGVTDKFFERSLSDNNTITGQEFTEKSKPIVDGSSSDSCFVKSMLH